MPIARLHMAIAAAALVFGAACGCIRVAGNTCQADGDGDAYGPGCPQGDDCDDQDLDTNPAAVERCDGKDNDCDGEVDDGIAPLTCGTGACARTVPACAGGVRQACSPGTPAAIETCGNGIDDNCDAQVDEGCTCTDGTAQPCFTGPSILRGMGVCVEGRQTCRSGRWGACQEEGAPSAEICGDGKDNDCDGVVDQGCTCAEGSTRACYTGPAATRGVGTCKDGSQACASGAWGPCAGEALPADEVCGNGLDEDCDGTPDDGCAGCPEGSTRPCYTGPASTRGVGACKAGVEVCSGGVYGACTGQVLPSAETCDNVDNNCDGTVDGFGQPCYTGPAATRGVGACADGVQVCTAGAFGACTGQVLPSAESCDNQDNDCDGTVDVFSQPCYTGPAPTRNVGVCKDGAQTCTAGVLGACTGEVVPSTETCDNQDNNCDGTVDGYSQPCYTGSASTRNVGECKDGTQVCTAGAFGACSGQVVPSAEACDNKDNDCNGTVDGFSEGCYDAGPASTRNVGECKDGTRLCTAGAFGACTGQVGPTTETCDSKDNDCNGAVDGISQACYTAGPAATRNVGECKDGTQVCTAGAFGACTGQVGPAAEICDNKDNNCDGTVDGFSSSCFTGPGTVGVGICTAGTSLCTAGAFGACTGQVTAQPETCDDGLDNNCNGVLDDGCIGTYVVPPPVGNDASSGSKISPVATLGKGITNAKALGLPRTVFVGKDAAASLANFTESVTLDEGVQLSGGWSRSSTGVWTRDVAANVTRITSTTVDGIQIPAGRTAVTWIDGFRVNPMASAPAGSTVRSIGITDSSPEIRANVIATGGGAHTRGITVTSTAPGAAKPLITGNTISGGMASATLYEIHVVNSAPTIDSNTLSGSSATVPQAWGIRCEGAANMKVQGTNSFAGFYGWDSVGMGEAGGIYCTGSVTGVSITGATINPPGGWMSFATFRVYGIRLESCGGTAATISSNPMIHGGGSVGAFPPAAGAGSFGVFARTNCPATIENNTAILGGGSIADEKSGVQCQDDSACVIKGNTLIAGATAATYRAARGVNCVNNSCASVVDNGRITGGDPSAGSGSALAPQIYGVFVDGSSPLVGNNRITAGVCGVTFGGITPIQTAGVYLRNAGATLLNNRIDGGHCMEGASPTPFDVHGILQDLTTAAQTLEPVVQFNTLHGGGSAAMTSGVGHGLRLGFMAPPSGTPAWGVYRNNIVNAGLQPNRHAVREIAPTADPRLFQNNDIWNMSPESSAGAMYLDEGTTPITLATLNGYTGNSANLSADPLLVSGTPGPSENFHIGSSASPCVNTGTAAGMPAGLQDMDGEVRPKGSAPDIGADEF